LTADARRKQNDRKMQASQAAIAKERGGDVARFRLLRNSQNGTAKAILSQYSCAFQLIFTVQG